MATSGFGSARFLIVASLLITAFLALPSVAHATDNEGIVRFGEDVTIEEGDVVDGSVVVLGADVDVAGTVDEDLVVIGGDAKLRATALVRGDVVNVGGTIRRTPGSQILGSEISGPRIGMGQWWINPFGGGFASPSWWLFWSLISLIGITALAVIVAAIFPHSTQVMARTLETRFWESLGIGFVGLIAIPIIVVLLIITIIGIILLPFFLLAIPVIFFFGSVGVARLLGRLVMSAEQRGIDSPVVEVLIGALLIGVIRLIPFLGAFVSLVVGLLGLGVIIISRFGTGRPWYVRRQPQAPAPKAE